MSEKTRTIVMASGGIVLLAGAALYITGWFLSPYLYCLGALVFASMQLCYGYTGDDLTKKRLRRQQMLGALLLLVAGVLMFATRHNEWIVCLTVAAVIELYTAFRLG